MDESSQANKSDERVDRIHYFDSARAIAMMLGLIVHGGLTYAAPSQQVWLLGDRDGSVAIDVIVWFIHLFRMALFYIIAGYFAKLLIEKRGIKGFVRNRLIRIVLVFVLFWPLLQVAFIAAIVFAIGYVQELPPVLSLIKNAPPGTPPPPPSTSHLWFLYYLAMFGALTVIFHRVPFPRFKHAVRSLLQNQFTLVWIPLLLVPAILRAGMPLPAPESFIPAWWPFAFYGLFYAFGWWLRGNENVLFELDRFFLGLLVVCALSFPLYYWLLPVLTLDAAHPTWDWKYCFESVLTAYLSAYLSLVGLLLCKRYLNAPSLWFRFIADSSYWTYLIHLPLMLFIQALLVDYHLSIWVKFALSLALTVAISLISYLILVRYTPIGWMLNGRLKRTKPRC